MLRDLERLRDSVLRMAGYVEDAVHTATRAVSARDLDAARTVVGRDTEIDELENLLQEDCLNILALHQPVAKDLRRIGTVMLITTDLERMGDLAVGIAERAIELAAPPHVPIPDRLDQMSGRATGMMRLALDAFVNEDAAAARAVIGLDDEVDRDNDELILHAINEMKRSPERVEAGVALFSIVRHIERIADHATNIAEDVIFLVEGAIVRHRHHEVVGGA
jgi:phosphate transport system protein